MIKHGSMYMERMRNLVGRRNGRNMVPLAHAVVILLVCAVVQVQGEVTIVTDSGSRDHLQSRRGSQFQLTCRSSDGSQVDWYHNSTSVEADNRHRLRTSLQNGPYISELTTVDVQFEDSGFYICQSRNFESDQLTISVVSDDSEPLDKQDVLSISILLPSTFDPLQRLLNVDANGDFSLKCYGSHASNLIWYHNGSELTASPPQVIITSSLDINTYHAVSLLSRNFVGDRESGVYECRDRVRGDHGDNVTVRVRRMETVPVEILEPPSKSDRVRVGASFEIKCKASNSSHLVWFFNGSQRLTDRRDSVQIKDAPDPVAKVMTSILRLENATTRNSGRYSCRNERDAGDSDTVTITVYDGESGSVMENGTPPMVATSVTLRIGSVTNLQCSFQASGDYRQEWMKDGRILQTGDKYIIQQDAKPSSLSIRFTAVDCVCVVERSDAGIYRCTFRYTSDNRIAGIVVFNATTIPCPPVDPPANGHLVQCPSPPVFGESCSFGCNHGYSLSNDTSVVCERQDGGDTYWSTAIPECTALSSNKSETDDVPTTISNVLLRIGSNLTLQCAGFLVFWTKQRHAIENGTKYTVDNNSLTIRNIERSDSGIYDCSLYRGQMLIGKNVFNVTSLACPKPPQLPHGVVEACSEQPVLGEHCVYRCDIGYTLHRSRLRSCELSGDENVPYWTGETAECLGSAEPWVSFGTSSSSTWNNNIPMKLCILYGGVLIRRDWILLVVVTFAQLLLPQSFYW